MNGSLLAINCALAALVPLIVGFIWYHPKVFGNAWMREANVSEEKLQKGNMFLIFGLTVFLSFIAAFALLPAVVHQMGAFGLINGDVEHAKPSFHQFMNDYGTAFRTFKHGALHGTMLAITLIFPLLAINGMFERKSWKYIMINAGFWLVCFALMGGILCGNSDQGFCFG